MGVWVLWSLLASLPPPASRADTVYLKNGRELEGLVAGETRTELTLDIGYGTVTLRKSDILRVKRSGAGQRQALAEEQQEKAIEAGQGVPLDGRELFDAYKKASAAREKALDAKSRRKALLEDQQSLEGEIDDLKHQYGPLAEELDNVRPYRGTARYNRVIDGLNHITTTIQKDQVELEDSYKRAVQNEEDVARYLSAFQDFKRLIRPREKDGAAFYAVMNRAYRGMSADFAQEAVAFRRLGPHFVVNVTFNDRVTMPMLVDTGASTTMITATAAERLNLDEKSWRGGGETVVADGRHVKVRLAVLDSIAVGNNRVEKSPIMVQESTSPGVEGLLGMSFLKNFVVQMDGNQNTLTLQRLK